MSRNPDLSRRTLLATIGAGGVAALLPGCRSAVEQADGAGAPTPGGVLRIAQAADISPKTLLSQNNPNMAVCRTVFNTLFEYDHRTLAAKPGLAESFQLADNGATVTLKLRHGVTFHSGRPFGAKDVLFTLEHLRKDTTSSQLKHVARAVADASATGDGEVRLRFDHPVSNLFDLFEIMLILDSESIGDLEKGSKLIGTGPYKVDSYTPGSGLKLSRNEKYFKRTYLDGVDISIVTQSSSMLSSLKSGQTHLALDMAPLDAASVRTDPAYELVVADPHDSTFYVASNVKVAPLDRKEVRQAIAWAIDRERVLKQVLGGIGSTSSLPWSPSSPAYDKAAAGRYHYDPARAKQLIAQSGAAGAHLDVVYNAGLATNAAIAEIVQYNLKEAGLDAAAVPLQAADFQGKLTSGALPGLFVNGHGFGHLNPATLVKGAFPFNADRNASNFDSAEYRQLADTLWKSTDDGARRAAAAKVNAFLLDEQFVSDLVVSAHTYAITRKVRGLAWSMFDYLNLDETYLVGGRP
ncbi:ABC transporter substrate-binding protein [Longispora sp. K20-0274]|uniref:ABC transporter substrate-binding protein n=1 Tax=Longispora sp. K20-0274 TaxID=3088255 RepID=UPI00399C26DB